DRAHESVDGVLDVDGVRAHEAIGTLLRPAEAVQEPRVLPGETLDVHPGPAADRLLVARELLQRLLAARVELLSDARADGLARAQERDNAVEERTHCGVDRRLIVRGEARRPPGGPLEPLLELRLGLAETERVDAGARERRLVVALERIRDQLGGGVDSLRRA